MYSHNSYYNRGQHGPRQAEFHDSGFPGGMEYGNNFQRGYNGSYNNHSYNNGYTKHSEFPDSGFPGPKEFGNHFNRGPHNQNPKHSDFADPPAAVAKEPSNISQGPYKPSEFAEPPLSVAKDDGTKLTAKALEEHTDSSNATVAMPERTAYTTKDATDDVGHQIISSLFIGPQAENLSYFKQNIDTILEELRLARTNYYPEDGVCPLIPVL